MTAPLVLPLVGGDWRASLLAWSAPIALIAILVCVFAPRSPAPSHATAPARKWLPDWHVGLVWRLGALFLQRVGKGDRTIGEALINAKRELGIGGIDAVLGEILLGDPASPLPQ